MYTVRFIVYNENGTIRKIGKWLRVTPDELVLYEQLIDGADVVVECQQPDCVSS